MTCARPEVPPLCGVGDLLQRRHPIAPHREDVGERRVYRRATVLRVAHVAAEHHDPIVVDGKEVGRFAVHVEQGPDAAPDLGYRVHVAVIDAAEAVWQAFGGLADEILGENWHDFGLIVGGRSTVEALDDSDVLGRRPSRSGGFDFMLSVIVCSFPLRRCYLGNSPAVC